MISQTSEYALRAVVHLAFVGGGPAVAQEIAEATLVPPGYLAKILRMLARAGVLQAQRGVGGGFTLARPAPETSVLDVLRAVDSGMERIHECPLGIKSHDSLCSLHQLLDDAIADVEKRFSSTSIQKVIDSSTRAAPLCETVAGTKAASMTVKGRKA